MSLISLSFLLLLTAAVIGYYLIPKRAQWLWLLIFSFVYYIAAAGLKAMCFILFTILTTYTAGRLIEGVRGVEHAEKKQKLIMLSCLIADFGMLAIVKYLNFTISNVNLLFGTSLPLSTLLLPLGISFYTFQSMGYLLDVYWERCDAERSFLRFALFVSFFPQILQGPISRYGQLSEELFREHSWDYTAFCHGLQLILWGYFKKLILTDRAGTAVSIIFQNYTDYTGLIPVLGVLFYSIQLYMDFSGGMDVVIGVSELFGISLTPNFKRPYFAVSIADFWRRWHITLGTWMKDYVFYPLSFSKWMGKIGKWARKRFGKKIGRKLPVCLANILVFLLVGIWHGAAWKYIVYGLYNGLLIAGSSLLEPVFQKGAAKCRMDLNGIGWHIVRIVRTFILVNISWFFDMAQDLPAAFYMMGSIFRGFTFRVLTDGTLTALTLSRLDYAILAAGCLTVFVVSLLQECGIKIRDSLSRAPLVLRWGVLLTLFFSIPMLGYVAEMPGGFLYAAF